MMLPPAILATAAMWPRAFHSFTIQHFLIVLAALSLMVGPIAVGCSFSGVEQQGERRWRRLLGIGGVLYVLVSNAWYLWPTNFDVQEGLPLHICDLAIALSPLALLSERRLIRTVVFFWGFALCTQAFVTPVLQDGPVRPEFWWFWLGHTIIVGTASYLVVVSGYRPRLRDYLNAIGVSVVYVISMVVLDEALGVNYGYVGSLKPQRPTVIDHLGPWPWRVVLMVGIGSAAMAILAGVVNLIPRGSAPKIGTTDSN